MKKIVKNAVLFNIVSVLACNTANAATLTVTSDLDFPSGGSWNGTYGIYSSTSNAGLPFKLTTGGDIDVSGSQHGIYLASGGNFAIESSDSSKSILFQNNSTSLGSVGIASYGGSVAVKDMNFIYNQNTVTTSSASANIGIWLNSGSVSFVGNNSGSNKISITDNRSNGHLVVGITLYTGNASFSSQNMNIEYLNNSSTTSNIAILNEAGINNKIDIIGVESGANSIKINNNTSTNEAIRGIYNKLSDAGSYINIENMDIEYIGNTAVTSNYAIQNLGKMNITGSVNRNDLIIRNNTGGALGILNASGSTTTITNMDVYSKSNSYFSAFTNGTLNLSNSTVNMEDANRIFGNSGGTSTINVTNGSKIYTGGGALIRTFGSAGVTTNINVDASYISGHAEVASGAKTNIVLANNSTWDMKKSSVMEKLTNNNSTVNLRSDTSGQYNTLTLTNYTGMGGTIKMNTELGDDSSLTDKIVVINGTANGSTILDVMVTGSNGDPETNGIKIVDAQGTSTITSDAFSLKGGQVDNSAYIYKLFQGDADDLGQSYYLRSTGEYSDTAKALANEPTAIVSIAKTGMNSLQKRLGEVRENSAENHQGVWVRAYGNDLKVRDKITTTLELMGTEAGYDHRWDFDGYKVYAGAMVGYIDVNNIENPQTNGAKDGTGDGDATSFGIYGTVVTDNGWFVDGVVRNFFEDLDLTSYAAGGEAVKYNLDRMLTAYSVEVGKQYKICVDCDTMFIIEPKVELMYAHADAKSFTSNYGNSIRYGNTDAFSTKASLMAGYKKKLDNGMVAEPFLQVGINNEWAGRTNVIFDGANYKSDMGGLSYEFGGGLNMQVNKSTSLYSDIMYETGDNVQSLSGNVGLRYTW